MADHWELDCGGCERGCRSCKQYQWSTTSVRCADHDGTARSCADPHDIAATGTKNKLRVSGWIKAEAIPAKTKRAKKEKCGVAGETSGKAIADDQGKSSSSKMSGPLLKCHQLDVSGSLDKIHIRFCSDAEVRTELDIAICDKSSESSDDVA